VKTFTDAELKSVIQAAVDEGYAEFLQEPMVRLALKHVGSDGVAETVKGLLRAAFAEATLNGIKTILSIEGTATARSMMEMEDR
jgi:hypothetical protein